MSWMVCSCMVCLREKGIPCFTMYSAPIREDSIYEVRCGTGAVTFLVAQEQKFEIISELALISYAKGDFSGSAIKLYTSLERFFEFCQKVVLKEIGLSDSEVSTYWKTIRSSSERQIGAFLIAKHISEKFGGYAWPEIGKLDDLARFRNKIVHQGFFPDANQTRTFATNILRTIDETSRFLKQHKSDALDNTISLHSKQIFSEARSRAERELKDPKLWAVGTVSMALQLSLVRNPGIDIDIDIDALANKALEMDTVWASGRAP